MVRSRDVLILGGSGFLGAHLVRAASDAARRGAPGAFDGVVSASRDPGPGPVAAGIDARRVDAVAPGRMEDLLRELRPVGVVLATALARVGECERYPGLAEELNARLPERVARWCAGAGARLVFVSTDLVFGGEPPPGRDGRGYREDDPPDPVHAYGRTKAAGERRVLELVGSGADALVVRLPLLFGDSGGRGLGASDQVLAALEKGETPRLFTDEWRAPLDAADAASALVELLEGDVRGVLHVAGPERLSRHELGCLVLAANGRADDAVSAVVRADLGMEGRPRDVTLDASRARALLATPLRAPAAALPGARS